jgi:hypothetical protein
VYVKKELSVIENCACAYNIQIYSLLVQNITGTSGRPALSNGPAKKRNRLCHFNKQTVKVPFLEILRYKTQKIIDKEFKVFRSSQALKIPDSDALCQHELLL